MIECLDVIELFVDVSELFVFVVVVEEKECVMMGWAYVDEVAISFRRSAFEARVVVNVFCVCLYFDGDFESDDV